MFQRQKIGEILVEQGKISQMQLDSALEEQVATHQRLGDVLVSRGLVSDEDLDEAQAIQFDVPYEPLGELVRREWLDLIPASAAQNFRAIPVLLDDHAVHVAMDNPNDVEAIDWIGAHCKKQVLPRFTPRKVLERALSYYYGSQDLSGDGAAEVETAEDTDRFSIEEAKRASEEPPVVSLVNTIFTDAIKQRASDIHLEPAPTALEIRYRVDGALRRARMLPKAMQPAVISRIKIMADLDISERRLPQDGRLGLKVAGRQVDMRVSTLPTRHGERTVLRILDRGRGIQQLDQLGFTQSNLNLFEELIRRPYGLVMVTGPTGSGKTTTLYAALLAIRSDTRNILTAEDPVEYELDGIGQSQVHERIGLTFAAQLRAALRQDPDVILVGEVRDQETAEIAARAAMTGHLVLTTLHTNDASSAIPRMLDMGIEPFLINSSLIGVVAQRLVRTICTDCKQSREATVKEQDYFSLATGTTVFWGTGCANCNSTGYRGRCSIHEVMVIDEQMRRLTTQVAQADTIADAARETGMVPIQQDAISKALAGVTTLEEIHSHIVTPGSRIRRHAA